MTHKGSNLTLDLTDVSRPPSTRYPLQTYMLVLAVVALGVALILSSAHAARPDTALDVDAARWEAIGQFYSTKALAAERSSVASVARWEAMGRHYTASAFDAERSNATNVARWQAIGEYYTGK